MKQQKAGSENQKTVGEKKETTAEREISDGKYKKKKILKRHGTGKKIKYTCNRRIVNK